MFGRAPVCEIIKQSFVFTGNGESHPVSTIKTKLSSAECPNVNRGLLI